jgi:hypothetical protein
VSDTAASVLDRKVSQSRAPDDHFHRRLEDLQVASQRETLSFLSLSGFGHVFLVMARCAIVRSGPPLLSSPAAKSAWVDKTKQPLPTRPPPVSQYATDGTPSMPLITQVLYLRPVIAHVADRNRRGRPWSVFKTSVRMMRAGRRATGWASESLVACMTHNCGQECVKCTCKCKSGG